MATNRKKNSQLNQFFDKYVCTENLYLVFEDSNFTIEVFNPLTNHYGGNFDLTPLQSLEHCIIYCQFQHFNYIRQKFVTPEILYILYPLTGKSLKFNVVTGTLETPGRKPRFKIPAKLKPVPFPGNEPV